MDEGLLRALGAVCSVAGSILLAWRVTGILKALGEVAKMHESNIAQLSKSTGDIFIAVNSPKWIERAQKLWLLTAGFGFLILGGLFQLAAAFV